MMGFLFAGLAGGFNFGQDDDDKDKGKEGERYEDLPKWARRSNICINLGKGYFITIPLSYELRVPYAMGEMTWEWAKGLIDPEEIAQETVSELSDLLPVSMENGSEDFTKRALQNLSPTVVRPIVDVGVNSDFTGKPIWKETDYNRLMPDWTKAYAGTSTWLVKSTEYLNSAVPKNGLQGDKYTPGAINVNPAAVEYLLKGYLGGRYTFLFDKGVKTAQAIAGDKGMQDVRNIPFVNRNLRNSKSGEASVKGMGDRYNEYMEEYRLSKQRFNGYRREQRHGVTDYLEKLRGFMDTPEGKRMHIIDLRKPVIDVLTRQLRDMDQYGTVDEATREAKKKELDAAKEALLKEIEGVK